MSCKLVLESTQAKFKDKDSYDAASVNQTSKLSHVKTRFGYQGT